MSHIARLVLYLAFRNSLSCITEHDVLKVHPCCRLQGLLEFIHVEGDQLGLSPPPILEEQRTEGQGQRMLALDSVPCIYSVPDPSTDGCRPHFGWVLPPQLDVSGTSFTDTPRVMAWAILNPGK